ncbi:MAG: PEP-CTERM sorting domain-containing protein [Candidatus Omnitrophica bacterium]|nr:PEP-CTERM sorting domain-containing protein [Candidatus Omnitrophota bacterium]
MLCIKRLVGFIGGLIFAIVALNSEAGAVLIDFDDQVLVNVVEPRAGNLYAAQGITFSSGNMSPDLNAAIAVGNTFTLTGILNEFVVIGNANAVSNPNFAGARSLGLQDTLMAFSSPISDLSLHSDDTGEGAQIIRLLSLAATANPDEYQVLAFDEKLDNAVSEPANLLSVNVPSGFSFALFQVTTEQEGFDDVNFTFLQDGGPGHEVIPEPTSFLLFGIGGLAAALAKRKKTRPS